MIFKKLEDLPTHLLQGEETEKLILLHELPQQSHGYERLYGHEHPTGLRHGLWLKVIGLQGPKKMGGRLRVSTIMQYDDQGRPHGPWGYYNIHGLCERRYFTDGHMIHNSKLRRVSSARYVSSELNYDISGEHHGRLFVSRRIEGKFSHGKRNGTFKYFRPFDGRIIEKCRYKNGDVEGVVSYYWKNGNFRCRIPLKSNVPHGWALYWTPEGELFTRKLFINGKTSREELLLPSYKRGLFKDYDCLEHARVLSEVAQIELGSDFLRIQPTTLVLDNLRRLGKNGLTRFRMTAAAEIGYVDPFFPKASRNRLQESVEKASATDHTITQGSFPYGLVMEEPLGDGD